VETGEHGNAPDRVDRGGGNRHEMAGARIARVVSACTTIPMVTGLTASDMASSTSRLMVMQ
jgi:hypothetical protein